MQDYRRLRVTHLAREVVRAIYDFSRSLPPEERFALSNQLRRAALSLALNIAEGCSRSTTKEFVRFLEIARGSGVELEFALDLTKDLRIGDATMRSTAAEAVNHALRALNRLITTLRSRLAAGTRV
jgi:four helix bundle protein